MDLARVVLLGIEVKVTVTRVKSGEVSPLSPRQLETTVASSFDYLEFERRRQERKRHGLRSIPVRVWMTYHNGQVGIPFYSVVDERRLRIYCKKLLIGRVGLEYKYWCHNGKESLPGPKLFSKLEYKELYKEMIRTGMAERVAQFNRHKGIGLTVQGRDFCLAVVEAPSPLPEVGEVLMERKRSRQAHGTHISEGVTQ